MPPRRSNLDSSAAARTKQQKLTLATPNTPTNPPHASPTRRRTTVATANTDANMEADISNNGRTGDADEAVDICSTVKTGGDCDPELAALEVASPCPKEVVVLTAGQKQLIATKRAAAEAKRSARVLETTSFDPQTPPLTSMALDILRRLPQDNLDKLVSVLTCMSRICANGRMSVGTACSGSDGCIPWMSNISEILLLGPIGHLWSCEADPAKRDFISKDFGVLKIFADVCTLHRGAAVNTVSGNLEQVDPVAVYIAGFVCKTLSTLNTLAGSRARITNEGEDSKTSRTWQGCYKFIQAPWLLSCAVRYVVFDVK
jgi:hypothetical protein